MQNGWWSGRLVVPELKTSNPHECGMRCCSEKACKLWIWRTPDKICHLKSYNDLKWHPASNHFAAFKIEGKTITYAKFLG